MIAYIIPVYPTLSETFIIREINALLESGRKIKIFSFRKEPTDHPIHKNTSIIYFNYVNTIYRNTIILFSIIKGLRVYSKFIIQALREIRFRSPLDVIKTIRHIHIGFYFATKIDSKKYSFIYGHWYNSSTICSVVHEITNIPFAVCFHANDFYREHKILPFKIEKSHAIVLNNTYNYYYFNSITNYQYSDKLRVILNCPPIIPKIFHPRKAIVGKINILSAGRIIHFKGHDILISACELLKENGYDFHVTIAGDGPNKEDIEQLVNKKNLNNEFQFIGSYKPQDIWSLFESSDILVHCSGIGPAGYRDGLPNVIIESMFACLPVIATYVSSVPEAIEDGSNGLLIPEKNPSILYKNIERLKIDPTLYSVISKNSPTKANSIFNKNITLKKLDNLFEI